MRVEADHDRASRICRSVLLAVCVVAGEASGQGAIQKCVGADGKVVYQDTQCDAGKTLAGKIARDTSVADPASLQRAREERARADGFAKSRATATAAEERRLAAAQAKADARARDEAMAAELSEPPVLLWWRAVLWPQASKRFEPAVGRHDADTRHPAVAGAVHYVAMPER
jgi:hypothetical protein